MAQRYNPTVDLIATSNCDFFWVGTNDDKDQNYQLSTTDGDKNDEIKYTIEPAKQSFSAEVQIETSPFAIITAVPTVAKKDPLFPRYQVPSRLLSIYTSRKL